MLFAILMAVSVRVSGATSCPSAEEVAARLRPLLPVLVTVDDGGSERAPPEAEAPPAANPDTGAPGVAGGSASVEATGAPDHLHVSRDGSGVRAELRAGDGTVLGQRRLASSYTCAEMAAAVAVAAATWESDVHPEFAEVAVRRPEGLAIREPRQSAPTPADDAGGAGRVDVGAGGGGLWAPAGDAPAFQLQLTGGWRPGGGRHGVRLHAGWQGARTLPLVGGQARWRRWVAGVSAERILMTRPTRLSIEAGLLVAAFQLWGEGFTDNRRALGVDPGAHAGLRWMGVSGAALVWAAAGVDVFVPDRRAYALPDDATGTGVPRWELALTLGVGWISGN